MLTRMSRSLSPAAIADSIVALTIITLIAVVIRFTPIQVAYQLFFFIEGMSAFMCL